jgi:hypothetical protein
MNMTRLMGLGLAIVAAGWLACGSSESSGTDTVDHGTTDTADVIVDIPVDSPADGLDVDTDVTPDTATDVAMDVAADSDIGPTPYLSARKVEVKADLVGGDNAYGIVGHAYVIENNRVRFLIQDAGTSVHLYLYGGNLIDADVRHWEGEPGNDQWREMFAIVGFRVCASEKVEVIKDGSDGKEAILRVTGRDANTNMIAMLDNMAQPLDLTLQNDYVLAPDSPILTLRTTAINDTKYGLTDMVAGDFLSFGGAQHVFSMENGFGDAAGDVAAIASTGRGSSYGYTIKSGTMNLPLVDASGTISLLTSSFAVPAFGQASFERYMVVGNGDVASVLDVIRQIRGEAFASLRGSVKDEAGAALAGARVTALTGTGNARRAMNQAITGADGAYVMGLPAGTYDMAATAPGRATRTDSVIVPEGGTTKDFAFAAEGRITLSIDEVDGAETTTAATIGPVPGKASLVCLDDDGGSDQVIEESANGCAMASGGGFSATSQWCELGMYPMGSGKGSVCTLLNSAHGTAATVPLKPGHYKIVVSRGPEYEQNVFEDVEIKAGETTTVAAKLFRSVDTSGYLSADFHQHTFGSLDSAMSPFDKTVANLNEGVEIAADTEHDIVRSYDDMIAAMQVGTRIHGLNGDEVSVNTVGHFNLFGWEGKLVNDDGTAGDMLPFAGTKLFSGKTQPQLTAAIRTIPGVSLWQMNHPRDEGSGYLTFIQFDPTTGNSFNDTEPMEWGYDMMEVKGYVGTPAQYLESADIGMAKLAARGSGDIPTMRDWFGWLNLGHPITATHNSDSHFRNHSVGWGRNFLRVGDKTPDTVTTADISAAVKAEQVIVSHGPFVQVFVEGVERMGHGDLVPPGTEGKVTVRLKVQAPTWMDVTSVEAYGNGRPLVLEEVDGKLVQKTDALEGAPLSIALPLASQPADGAVRADVDVVLSPAVDTWYVFLVRGALSVWPLGGGTPLGYTNALYVDVGGNGFTGSLQ